MLSSRHHWTFVVLLVAGCHSVHADPLFHAPFRAFGLSREPERLATGDLNRDGRADIAATLVASTTVAVLLATDDGLGTPIEYEFDTGVIDLAIHDLDLDGNLDLAVAAQFSVWILLGDGNGGFRSQRAYPTDKEWTWTLVVGDLNGDGIPDFALTGAFLTLLFGIGGGALSEPIIVDLQLAGAPRFAAIDDLNDDGRADLILASAFRDKVTILYGDGSGTSYSRLDYSAGTSPVFVAVADMNEDGHRDIVVASTGDQPSLSILVGMGNESFRHDEITQFVGRGPTSVAVADLDLDENLDLVITRFSYASIPVSMFRGRGDGTFQPRIDLVSGGWPNFVVVSDVNLDTKPDLVVAAVGAGAVVVHYGNGDGSFGDHAEVPTAPDPRAIAIADLNADRHLDLVVANGFSNRISVMLGNEASPYRMRHEFFTGIEPNSLAIGDLDGDEQPDVATANFFDGGSTISVLPGKGDGTFTLRTDLPAGGRTPASIVMSDLDGDGSPELVSANMLSNTVSVRRAADPLAPVFSLSTGTHPIAVAAGDLDGDTRADLVVANSESRSISVLMNEGETFRPRTDYVVGDPGCVALGDVDEDSRIDVVVGLTDVRGGCIAGCATSVVVLLGSGDGTLGAPSYFPIGTNTQTVVLGDLDGDHHLDIATANKRSNTVSVLLGNGDGTFARRADFGTGFAPGGMAIADLDANGRLDLVFANQNSGTVGFLWNTLPPLAPLTDLRVQARLGEVLCSWTLTGSLLDALAGVVVERSTQADGPYITLTIPPLQPEESMSFRDGVVEPGLTYWYRIVLLMTRGSDLVAGKLSATIPWAISLSMPSERASGLVGVTYTIGEPSTRVSLGILDVRGRLVRIIDEGIRMAGSYERFWDRTDHGGQHSPRGVYFVRLRAGGTTLTQKLLVLHP